MRLRSSLGRVPSEYTAEELVMRSRRHQSEAWQTGLLVVHVSDDRLAWPEVEMIKQIGNRLAREGNIQ